MSRVYQFIKQNFIVFLLLLILFYFLSSLFFGEFGYFRNLQIQAELRVQEKTLASLKAEREDLQNLTYRLSHNHLDLELLDEQARKRLGYLSKNEIIIR